MAEESDSFNSTGSVVSFETLNNNNQAFGVSVTGSQCGVYGESSSTPIGTRPSKEFVPEGTGVCGRGEVQGVLGDGAFGVAGVGDVVGVAGEGRGEGSIGVFGQRSFPNTPNKSDAAVAAESLGKADLCAVGLRAYSACNRAGVFHVGLDHRTPPDLNPGELVAQIHLAPIHAHQAPSDGKAGDLIAFRREPVPSSAELWFCTDSSTDTQPAKWMPIAKNP